MRTHAKIQSLNVSELVKKINQAQTIILTTHKQCDGDGLGAMMALYYGLKKVGKKVRVIAVDEVPKKYHFLNPELHIEVFEKNIPPIQKSDLALIFDTNDKRLVAPLFEKLEENCGVILFVDHHPILNEGPEPTENSYIETQAASTGEIAFFILKGLNLHFDESIARALYTSIIFDTQLYRFVRNSPNSHLIAAELLTYIHNAEEIHRYLFATHTKEKISFLALAFSQIEYFAHNQIAVLKLRRDDILKHNLDMDDSRDVIDMIMNINSLQAAALFREDATQEYKMSLRSKGQIEVLGIAEEFQGGGHMFASGATIKGNYDQVKNRVVELLHNRLKNRR